MSALGFPESDEQTEEDLKNDNPTFYCRDWLVDKLGEVVAEGGTAREYIEWAKEQLHPMYEPPS